MAWVNEMGAYDVPGYIYVATSDELIADGIAKIGVTRNLRARLSNHRRNSSSPYSLFCFAGFRFETFIQARRVENWVKRELRNSGFKCENKTEFFQVSPSTMCDAIHDAVEQLELQAIEQFPSDIDAILGKAGDFVSLPRELLACLTPEEAKAYWQGAKDILWILSRLEGIAIHPDDYRHLWRELKVNAECNEPSAASTVSQYFRNRANTRSIGERVSKEVIQQERHGFSWLPREWSIPDWRHKAKTA
ncbi:MAG: GIY-YIG nuclease family protein [Xanthobacteraceae bacterium]